MKEIYNCCNITFNASNGTFQEEVYLNGYLCNVYSVIGTAWERPEVEGDTEFIIEHDHIHQNRIPLNVTKKKIIHINIDDIENLVLPENVMVKLVIHGEQSKITSFKLSNKYK